MNKYKRFGIVAIIVIVLSSTVNAVPLVPAGFNVDMLATGLGQFPQSIDIASDGSIYTAGTKQTAFGGNPGEGGVYRISPAGSVTQIGSFTDNSQIQISNDIVQGVKVLPNGDLFVSSTSDVLKSTGGNSFGAFASSTSPRFNAQDIKGDIVIIGNTLYMAGGDSGSALLWNIDMNTGSFGSLALGNDITALDFDAVNNRLIGGGAGGIFDINPLSGSMNLLSFSDIGLPQTQTVIDPFTGEEFEEIINPSSSVGQIAVHPVTGEIYFSTLGSQEILKTSNTGKVSIFSGSGFDVQSLGLAFNDAGDRLYTTDRGSLYEISGIFVPVPAAVWLFVSGLLSLIGLAKGKHAG